MTAALLNRTEAAGFLQVNYSLKVTRGSLATMATRGGGPPFLKQGRYAFYLKRHLREWAEDRCSGLLDSTSTPFSRNCASGHQPVLRELRENPRITELSDDVLQMIREDLMK